MYRKIPVWITTITIVIAALLIYFEYVILGAFILISVGMYSMVVTIAREIVRNQTQNRQEFDYSGINSDQYIDLVFSRGNIYSVYNVNPDEIMDAI